MLLTFGLRWDALDGGQPGPIKTPRRGSQGRRGTPCRESFRFETQPDPGRPDGDTASRIEEASALREDGEGGLLDPWSLDRKAYSRVCPEFFFLVLLGSRTRSTSPKMRQRTPTKLAVKDIVTASRVRECCVRKAVMTTAPPMTASVPRGAGRVTRNRTANPPIPPPTPIAINSHP